MKEKWITPKIRNTKVYPPPPDTAKEKEKLYPQNERSNFYTPPLPKNKKESGRTHVHHPSVKAQLWLTLSKFMS